MVVTPHFIDLVYDAALKSYWRRNALRGFLRRCSISESFLATWTEDETKRGLLDRLFPELSKNEKGQLAIIRMAECLVEQQSFPDLRGWPDSESKIREAHQSIQQLKKHLQKQQKKDVDLRERVRTNRRFKQHQEEVRRSQLDLEKLNSRLTELVSELGTQTAGYSFQDWFYELMDYSEVAKRPPYMHEGRQMDGSVTLTGTTYLVELKFTRGQATATDIDSFYKKVTDKADNTMGIMVSISGYSGVAVKEASGPRTPLLLLDSKHIYAVLTGLSSFAEIVERVRRHSSQTGVAYIAPEDFGL